MTNLDKKLVNFFIFNRKNRKKCEKIVELLFRFVLFLPQQKICCGFCVYSSILKQNVHRLQLFCTVFNLLLQYLHRTLKSDAFFCRIALTQIKKSVSSRELGQAAQFFFDSEKLIVFCHPSLRLGAPVLVCPALTATEISAMVVASVFPERWETMAV